MRILKTLQILSIFKTPKTIFAQIKQYNSLTGEYEHRNRANGEEGEEVKTTMMIFEQRQWYLAMFICMILFYIQDDGKQQSICVNATSDEGGGGIVFIN